MDSHKMPIHMGAPRVQALAALKVKQVGALDPQVAYQIVNAEKPAQSLADDDVILRINISTDNQGEWDVDITKGEFFADTRAKTQDREDASELINYGETLLSSIDHNGDTADQLRALDEIERLAASLRARISGVEPGKPAPKTFALLKVSKRRWAVLRRVCDHLDATRRIAYTQFEFEWGGMPYGDAKAELEKSINELTGDEREAHRPIFKPEKHHGINS